MLPDLSDAPRVAKPDDVLSPLCFLGQDAFYVSGASTFRLLQVFSE